MGDLGAGLTVAVIALPLAMALAIASGTTPERGIFTAIIAGFIISFLGGSRVQIGGPTGAFVVIVYSIIEEHGYEGLAIATAMAGVILIIMGILKFGNLIKFIPFPVTTGFTTGIAVVIFSTQIKDFFGLRMGAVPSDVVEQWSAYAANASTWSPSAFVIAFGSVVVILLARRFIPKFPGAIIAVVLAAVAVHWLALPVETIGSKFGGIPSNLPTPSMPVFTLEKIRMLVPEATTIALLCAIESLLSAVVADGMTGYRHRSNCELVAQGVANLGSVLFGGIPATGAIARTSANVKAGASTPIAGIIHAGALLLILLLAAPLASLIPLSCLAGVLVLVAWNMSERRQFMHLFKAPKSDQAVLITTFLLTVLVDLTVAVQVGMVLSALLFMKRMSEVTNVSNITRDWSNEDEGLDGIDRVDPSKIPAGAEVFEINGPLFFGVVDRVSRILGGLSKKPDVFILRVRHVLAVDASGLHALSQLLEKCRHQQITLVLSGLHAQPLVAIHKDGLDELIGEENLCGTFDEALERAEVILSERGDQE